MATDSTTGSGRRDGHDHGRALGGEGVAGGGVGQLGHGHDVAGLGLVDGLGLFAPQQLQDVEPLIGVGAGIGEDGVGADRPRQHAQERDLADVGVGDGLEHLGQGLARAGRTPPR